MMDPTLKERLLDGLEDAVANYNNGMDEETAIAKSASDHNFNKAQTERLVELYNTSLTVNHFEKDAANKAAFFRLADKNGVLDLLFDADNEKMASEFKETRDASPDYMAPETDFYGCKSAEEFDFDPVFEPTENDIPNLGANSRRMNKQLSRLQKEAEHLEAEAGIAIERARSGLSKLATRMSEMYSANEMGKLAAVVGLLAKPENASTFNSLSHYLPGYVLKCNIKLANVVDSLSIPEEARLVKAVSEFVKAADDLQAEADRKFLEHKQASEKFDELLGNYARAGRTVNEMDQFISTKQADMNTALTAFAFGSLPKYVSDIRKTPKVVDKEVEDANKRLNNVHREMLLADLINNDSYLSEEDPKVIAGYYSHFAELSPELANNKEVVRSVLRQAVHNGGGGYSPFDAGSFMDAEKTLKEIRGTLPPKRTKRDMDDDEDRKKG